jgi:hypothetical protein
MQVVEATAENWNLLQVEVQKRRIIATVEAFQANRIEPILIKGWAAARHYPDLSLRRPGDIDITVNPKEFTAAQELIARPDFPNVNIDLHSGLRHLDTLEWLVLFERSQLCELGDGRIRVLSDEDHLRLLCVHWLVDGGRFKDKLWDIYYAVENRHPDFDWKRCLDVVSPIRRRWVICAIAIAHAYLGLNISGLPFEPEANNIPAWINKCLEKEWKQSYHFEPILTSTHDSRLLAHQIFRRLPPNPIRATIEEEGDLYGNRRAIYQAKVIARRLGPFSRDLFHFVRLKMRGKF